MDKILISGEGLTLDEINAVCRHDALVVLSDDAKLRIEQSCMTVEEIVGKKEVVYGVNTGFGKFSDKVISSDEVRLLQKNLIMTHAVGAGPMLSRAEVRGIMLLRINNLAKGFSGIRLQTVNVLVDMLNKGVTPLIPQKGSLGASGDLAPLAHMVLPMIGLGKAEYKGDIYPGDIAMHNAGIPVIELAEKEGLALINGTQVMTSIGSLVLYDALDLLKIADIALALSFEAHKGIVDALEERMHIVRPHVGQINTARILRELLEGSENVTHQGEIRTQDAYSLRCGPQVHGASKDAINYIKKEVDIEINSVTDNPIIFSDTQEGVSGGNFHGQPMALSFDFLGIAVAELANISERRIERMVNPSLSGLPAFLTEHGGLNSGFMIVQYSAASLVSENKVLAHPACVDSIPSSAGQEDHVSMGTIAANKARTILQNTRRVLAMELMCACQAIDLRKCQKLGKGTSIAYKTIREVVAQLYQDRPLYDDINRCEQLIIDGTLINRIEKSLGTIKF